MSLVTLVSGGLDSTLLSLMVKEEGLVQFPLFVNYGQLCYEKEWKACQQVHSKYELPMPVQMDLSGYGKTIPSGLTNKSVSINDDAFLPGRNMMFLLAGATYAYSKNANAVSLGVLNDEYRLFPDQTDRFFKSCEATLEVALGRKIMVLAPLLRFSKRDVIEMAKSRGLSGTSSCQASSEEPCGVCVACVEFSLSGSTLKGGN